MPWNAVQIDSQILAVHAALVPNGPQGEVVLFGGDEHWVNQQESSGNNSWKKTRVYDVATHGLVPGQIQSPDSDVFCAHHVFIGDGRLLIAGGTSEWPNSGDAHGHHLDFLGHSRCWLYSPRQRAWRETARLGRNPGQPNEPRSGGRWYPGLVAMGDGSAVAFFGHLDKNDFRHRNTRPERYFPGRQSWVNLSSEIAKPGQPSFGDPDCRFLFFARAYILPSGKIFSATPLPTDFAAQPNNINGPHFSTAFDANTGQYALPRAAAADGVDGGWDFPSVLLPLIPIDGRYNARVLFWDGSTPKWIDTDSSSPAWTSAGPRAGGQAGRQRINGNAVLLPTGQVCQVGGVNVANPEDPMRKAEIYTPDINWTTGAYGNGGGSWTTDATNSASVRNYHSTALLLPNGKVWTAGGSVNAQPGDPNTVGVKLIELYEPDYIAVANRVQIQASPVLLAYGQEFDVQIDRAATNISRAALIRNGSVTHATDNDQRYVGLQIVSRSGNSIRFRSPPNGNVAPPGYYMLWLVDTAGNPCQLARFVRVAHLACRVIANRSTFSEEEVRALGGGANAVFGGSLYVDFDGFIASELSGTPAFTLEWSGGGAIPANQLWLQLSSRYSETDPPEPDVPTRITFAFDLIFQTMGAYSGWLDRRDVVVRFTLGTHVCQAVFELSKSPNPYMIDIDPVAHNADWLSTDVRVFKVRMNETRFGSSVGVDPNAYIQSVVDRLRTGLESFASLPPDGAGTVLSGAFMTGFPPEPVFNFAVARVRYRATATTAQSVRCFFRLCNVAATGLQFDTNTVYRRTPGPAPVPLLGTAGGQIVSIPFFNAPRVTTVMGQAGATSMANQTLDSNYDIQNITPVTSGAEVYSYFGVFLDLNLPTKRFPIAPPNDGPFADATAVPIRDLLRSWHNCLVAEIFFGPDPTRAGAGPADSDNLSQRNLAIIGLENPGLPASRTAMHTFEISPSQIDKGEPIFNPTVHSIQHNLAFVAERQPYPDELFFDWHNLPATTEITLYFSDIDTAEIQNMLASRISAPVFTILDSKTVRFKVGDCAWLPIPGSRSVRIPALISIALPDGIIEGQVYRATIRQVNGRSSTIMGSITIEMPVSKAVFLRPEAEQQLSFMGHIAKTLPSNDRWKPLFDRLIAHLAGRVDALGGASAQVEPNPDGSGKPYVPAPWRPGDPFPPNGFGSGPAGSPPPPGSDIGTDCGCCWPGWIVAAALVLILTTVGFLPGNFALPIVALMLLALAIAGYCWSSICKGRILCGFIDRILLGSTLAAGVLALGSVIYGAAIHPLSLPLAGAIAIVAIVASYVLRCRGKCCD